MIVMLDSVSAYSAAYGEYFLVAEWIFTILFTIEYLLRLISVNRPLKYATSFFGMIDLMAVLPTYASLFFPAGKYFVVIRVLRVLRVFRVLKFVQYIGEADMLVKALLASRRKITIFIFSVLAVVIIIEPFSESYIARVFPIPAEGIKLTKIFVLIFPKYPTKDE